jgi:hypothetical protein
MTTPTPHEIAELPIMKNYLPTWKVWEGLREIVQNGIDEQTQHDNTLSIIYNRWENKLTVHNAGATLDPRAFLFGYTSKAGDDATIGQYGEGLKLGVLALVRAKKGLIITVGRDAWVAGFQRSKKFNATILTFTIHKNVREAADANDVGVIITGVTEKEYEMMRSRIIPLMEARPTELGSDSYHGSVLTDPDQKGRLYVKGIWVCNKKDLAFGYNFGGRVEVNRDRNFIADWDVSYHASHAISTMMRDHMDDKKLMRRVYDVLKGGRRGTKRFREAEHLASALNTDVKAQFVEMFRKKHGKRAVPVNDENGAKQAEFCGAQGVVVPKSLTDALAEIEGMGAKDLAHQTHAVTKYELSDLTTEERETFEAACLLVNEARNEKGESYFDVHPEEINIVDFNRDTVRGLFSYGKISLARKILSEGLDSVLGTLVHEVCHYLATDGARAHTDAQSQILAKIAVALWNKPTTN